MQDDAGTAGEKQTFQSVRLLSNMIKHLMFYAFSSDYKYCTLHVIMIFNCVRLFTQQLQQNYFSLDDKKYSNQRLKINF